MDVTLLTTKNEVFRIEDWTILDREIKESLKN